MSLITRMRRQKAVYWSRGAIDRNGKYTYAEPVEIACRWDDESEEFFTPDGKEAVSKSIVYVDRDMKPGDFLRVGTLAELTGDISDPRKVSNAWEVRGWSKIANIRATEFLRRAYL